MKIRTGRGLPMKSRALRIAQPEPVRKATLGELKAAVRTLRTLHPGSDLADLVEARITALEELCRKRREP
ncbi:hypothetical protein C4E04_16380 [Microvirga sp. 17 mud 1-3]|nr:hypothetical protein C4E04_16380 [Microvirga sp. 17 mud 1-3]